MALEFKDYYQTLGVPRSATQDDIKKAFRKLARLYHPDVAKNKVAAEAKFKEINEAYEVLGDAANRVRYDELGANWKEGSAPQPGPGRGGPQFGRRPGGFEYGGTGFSDFFESFFGGAGRGYGPFGRATGREDYEAEFAHPGADVEADILVTLEEALRGSKRRITLRRPSDDGGPDRTDTYQVRIPPGVREGQRIRLAGQGSSGYGGAAAGDLYLRVRLARHPDFAVEGADLHCELNVAPWEAVLGAEARIPTLDGTTSVRVAPGTAGGGRLRLRGLGLPKEDGGRGDLYATVVVQTPSSVSEEERALWEKLAQVSPFKPAR